MLPLSTVAILEKNKLSSDGAWLVMLEVQLQNLSADYADYIDSEQPVIGTGNATALTIRVVRNNEDIYWNGNTWVAFPFVLDEIGESTKGELPQVAVRIANITRTMQQYVEASDGGVGATVIVRVVHSSQVKIGSKEGAYYSATATPEIELTFAVTATSCDAQWVTFTLGLEYPTMLRFPQKRVLKDWCHYPEYKGIECGAAAVSTIVTTSVGSMIAAAESTAGIIEGATITGNVNIPAGTTVMSVTSATSFIMSREATGTGPFATMFSFTTCNRTLKDCRTRNNSARFGGFASIPMGGIYG